MQLTSKKKKPKSQKTKIPKAVRMAAWREYNGPCMEGKCFACGRIIYCDDFDAAHVIAEANGGQITLDNLRPVCRPCNRSCGTLNLMEFVTMFRRKDITVPHNTKCDNKFIPKQAPAPAPIEIPNASADTKYCNKNPSTINEIIANINVDIDNYLDDAPVEKTEKAVFRCHNVESGVLEDLHKACAGDKNPAGQTGWSNVHPLHIDSSLTAADAKTRCIVCYADTNQGDGAYCLYVTGTPGHCFTCYMHDMIPAADSLQVYVCKICATAIGDPYLTNARGVVLAGNVHPFNPFRKGFMKSIKTGVPKLDECVLFVRNDRPIG